MAPFLFKHFRPLGIVGYNVNVLPYDTVNYFCMCLHLPAFVPGDTFLWLSLVADWSRKYHYYYNVSIN